MNELLKFVLGLDITEEEGNQEIEEVSQPEKVIIEKDEFDLSQLPDWQGEKFFHFSYKPQTFREFIGQKRAKELLKTAIRRYKVFNEPIHIFLQGLKGHGKTTLAKIIANELDGYFIYRTASQLENTDVFVQTLKEIYLAEKYPVLFLDEIHTLDTKIIEQYFYSLMEDFRIGNKNIRPFTLICATTEEDLIARKLPPFLDRFSVVVNLERYSVDDIYLIIKQYQKKFLEWHRSKIEEKRKLFSDEEIENYAVLLFKEYVNKIKKKSHELVRQIAKIQVKYQKDFWTFTDEEYKELAKTDEGIKLASLIAGDWMRENNLTPKALNDNELKIIAKNSRLTPRIAINYLKSALVSSVDEVLEANRIIKNGLTDIDLKILKTLKESKGPVGEEALAYTVGLTCSKYRNLYEPFLVLEGYITRTLKGRKITSKGKKILEELEENLDD